MSKPIAKPQSPRVHWDAKHGWLVDTTFPMTRRVLQACVDYTLKAQGQRVAGMIPGPARDQLAAALRALSVDAIQQNIQPAHPWEQERIVYAGSERVGDKIISLGAA